MLLGDLLEVLGDAVLERTGGDPEVRSVTHDSRSVVSGSLFCCVPGGTTDGHQFGPDAVSAGADALLVERILDGVDGAAQVRVRSAREAMAPLAARFHGDPSLRLAVAGITGTNGKTTTVHLLGAALAGAGRRTGEIGTLTGARTTPEAPELQARLAEFRDQGFDAVAMEVSSHALVAHRVDSTRFRVGAFTNLSRDHLDFHGTMDEYFDAKALLFEPGRCQMAVIDVDGEWGVRLADLIEAAGSPELVRCSLQDVSDLQVELGRCRFGWRGQQVELPLGGRHNAANAVMAAEIAVAMGAPPDAVAAGLAGVTPVAGRFERVVEGQPFEVVVDYAHTPDGIEKVLEGAREAVGSGRVLVVFGCGGDRDRSKRPEMGRVAAAGADEVVVTSDNPRSEPPEAIIRAVTDGIHDLTHVRIEPDRRAAIDIALRAAGGGDVVVIAGKGHETTQETAGVRIAFDDREVARELLRAQRGPAARP